MIEEAERPGDGGGRRVVADVMRDRVREGRGAREQRNSRHGWGLVMEKASRKGVRILPVDSEHSAIFQCLEGQRREYVKRIVPDGVGRTLSGCCRLKRWRKCRWKKP